MKLLIQLTFNNGLGNLYCGAVDILHFANHYKNLGYDCELVFASNGSLGYNNNKYIDFVDFEDIFDADSFKIFNKIRSFKVAIGQKEYEGYTYHSTQYGPDYPGAHWWDVFFDVFPKINHTKVGFNPDNLHQNTPIWLPKLNEKIYKKVDKFLEKNGDLNEGVQIRYGDYTLNPPEEFKTYCRNLSDKLQLTNRNFYVTSHNQFAIDTLSTLDNVVAYEYKNINELPNDHCYYFYHKNLSREIYLERLHDNLAEMVLLSKLNKIYFYFHSICWTSTFLYYSKSHNPDQQLININTDLNLIE
jgi:hypothetical protein